MIVSSGNGTGSFENPKEYVLSVINFESFLNGTKSKKFEGRQRCDFIIDTEGNNDVVILNEHTTAKETVDNLKLPVKKFVGGKYEKVQYQLSDTLSILYAVPSIKKRLEGFIRKICLMSYKIEPRKNPTIGMIKAPESFGRYKTIESQETRENGSRISCPEIEKYGFEYRRIEHSYAFKI